MNSLAKRIDKIETMVEADDNLIAKIRRIENQKKQKQLESLFSSFKLYLVNVEITDFDVEIVKTIAYTLKYYNENELNISKLLQTRPSDEIRLEVIITLIQELSKLYSTEFIASTIEFLDVKPIEPIDIPKKSKSISFFKNK